MATNVSDYGAAYWLGTLFGVNTVPSTYYVALVTEAPDQGYDGTMLVEPTDTAYARQAIAADATHWSAPDSGFISNLLVVSYPTPAVSWGLITHFVLCSAATAGNIYAYGEFTTPQVVDASNALIIPIGGITMAVTGPVDSIVS